MNLLSHVNHVLCAFTCKYVCLLMELEKIGNPDDTSMETNKHLHKQIDLSGYI